MASDITPESQVKPALPSEHVSVQAHGDADKIIGVGKSGDVQKQADAYHDAYSAFADQLKGQPAADQTKALNDYRADMGRELGSARLGQLDLVWADKHLDKFQSAHQTETATTSSGRQFQVPTQDQNLDGGKLAGFKSSDPNSGEKAFENSVAADLSARYNKSEFHYFGHEITPGDLTARANALGKDASTVDTAREEARGLLSPVSADVAARAGIKPNPDGSPSTLYDLISQKDGSGIKKYGYDTQFAKLHEALAMDPRLTTPEQAKTLNDLWDKWENDPLKGRDGAITPESIKAATADMPTLPELTISQEPPAKPAQTPGPETPAPKAEAAPPAAETKPTDPEAPARKPETAPPAAETKPTDPEAPARKPETAPPAAETKQAVPEAPARKPEAAPPAAETKQADPEAPARKPETAPQAKAETKQNAEARVPAPAPEAEHTRTFELKRGSLIDQVASDMRHHNHGRPVAPEAARAQLARIAEANHWPGTAAQWEAYVKTGADRHLPKALNTHLRTGMEITVPN